MDSRHTMQTMQTFKLETLDILVVDDDPTACLVIERILSRHGARVQCAGSGAQALKLFAERHHPVVITDICMPEMNGIQLVENLRRQGFNIQVIAVTAEYDTELLISAIQLGFNDYIIKPVDGDKLLWTVKRGWDAIMAQRKLEEEQIKFQTVVECIGEGIVIMGPDSQILHQNSAMTEMFGDLTGSPCYKIFNLNDHCPDCITREAIKDGQTHSAFCSYQRNGTILHTERTASLLRDAAGAVTGTVAIFRDISERIRNEQIIRDMAFHDPLTGLSNRRLFEDRLQQTIAKSRRYGRTFGLLYLDLDHFKEVNDTYGHEAGDLVLVEAAERIKFCCKRDLDTICRQGGDEFCIIITDCGGRENQVAIAKRLLEQFRQPFQLADTFVELTTSIGISIFPDNGVTMKEIEIASDKAMYAAKKAGRNTYCFWEPYAESPPSATLPNQPGINLPAAAHRRHPVE
jgi:diguanylate cyclase (GGDEF)-like protein/PAS domain S-box-containing protein